MIDRHYDQRFRSLLASLEILAAAAVSNALVLGSFVRDRGSKKTRFRIGSHSGQSTLDRSATAPHRAITARTWGSDADLVGDLGIRLNPELTEKPSSVPRPAPLATSLHSPKNAWTFPTRPSLEADEIGMKSPVTIREFQPSMSEVPTSPRHLSYSDVGGLLGENDPPLVHHRNSMVGYQRQPVASPSSSLHPPIARSTRGSRILLQDIGGLMEDSSPSPRTTTSRPPPCSQNPDLIEALQSTPPSTSTRPSLSPTQRQGESPGLQDIGGLLSPSPQPIDPGLAPDSQHSDSGLIEALQSTPPNSPLEPVASPKPQRVSRALQDVGGLLS